MDSVTITLIISAGALVLNLFFGGLGALFAYMKLVSAVKDKVADGQAALALQIAGIKEEVKAQIHELQLHVVTEMTAFKAQIEQGREEFKETREFRIEIEHRVRQLEDALLKLRQDTGKLEAKRGA